MSEPTLFQSNWESSCDHCVHQEGRHYCLLHSVQVKNMDALKCSGWAPKPNFLPCPFCGSTRIVKGERYFALCVDCGATGPERNADATMGKIVKDWNSRVDASFTIRLTQQQAKCLRNHLDASAATAVAGSDVAWMRQITRKLEAI